MTLWEAAVEADGSGAPVTVELYADGLNGLEAQRTVAWLLQGAAQGGLTVNGTANGQVVVAIGSAQLYVAQDDAQRVTVGPVDVEGPPDGN